MECLEYRALRLPLGPKRRGESILALQRTVGWWTRLLEKLVAEVAQPVPVGRAHQLAALEANARRLRHADAYFDRIAINLLQRAVVALAKEAEEQVYQ
jgi:hypothetical protein